MLIEFMTAIAAGFVGAGGAMLLRSLSGERLPRAMIPVFAGIGMIGVTVWNEYTWYDRIAATLPEQVVVVQTHAEPSTFRPWTYALPYVSRFMAVNRAAVHTNDQVPGQRLTEVLLYTHRQPARNVPLLIDCEGARRADIADGMEFDDAGRVTNADWQDMETQDPLLSAVCS